MARAEISKQVAVTLRLSEDEARLVYFLLGHVGGDQTKSPRRHASAVYDALEDVLEPIGDWRDKLKDALEHRHASFTFKYGSA